MRPDRRVRHCVAKCNGARSPARNARTELPELAQAFGVEPADASLLITLPLAAAPLLYGYVLQAVPARPMLITASLVLALCQSAMALVDTWTLLLALRVAVGLTLPALFAAVLNLLPFRMAELHPEAGSAGIGFAYLGYLSGLLISLNAARLGRRFGSEARLYLFGLALYALGRLPRRAGAGVGRRGRVAAVHAPARR